MEIRERVLAGETGARPGWCRVSLHWLMSDEEIDYLIEAVAFLAEHAACFAGLYDCDPQTGAWSWGGEEGIDAPVFPARLLSGEGRVKAVDCECCSAGALRSAALCEAHELAARFGAGAENRAAGMAV